MPEGISRKRAAVATALTWIVGAAVLTLLFVAYQLWGTGISEAHAQKDLASDFQALTHSAASSNEVKTKLIVEPPPKIAARRRDRPDRDPAIGVDKYVVEGTERDDLEQGPGHYIGSSVPGHPGNVAIAGHRTTYGAPFNRLDELKVGDKIYVQTVEGRFLYTVSELPYPVSPYDNDVVQDYGDNRLTLTTCNPKFSAAQRLIVVAKFQGDAPEDAQCEGQRGHGRAQQHRHGHAGACEARQGERERRMGERRAARLLLAAGGHRARPGVPSAATAMARGRRVRRPPSGVGVRAVPVLRAAEPLPARQLVMPEPV